MIETIVREYLIRSDIEKIGKNVFLETPEDAPQEYIVIEKTASGDADRIESAMIAVQSISKKRLLNAASINEAVKECMKAFAEESNEIYSCRLNSDYNFTNTSTKEYRYQAVFNLYF